VTQYYADHLPQLSFVNLLYLANTEHAVLNFQHYFNAKNDISSKRVHSVHTNDCLVITK